MQTSTLFIVLGVVFLLLGISLIVTASAFSDWYKNFYDSVTNTTTGQEPEKLIMTTNIIGGILTAIALFFITYGYMSR